MESVRLTASYLAHTLTLAIRFATHGRKLLSNDYVEMMDLSSKDALSDVLKDTHAQSSDPSLWAIFGHQSSDNVHEGGNESVSVEQEIFDLSQLSERPVSETVSKASIPTNINGLSQVKPSALEKSQEVLSLQKLPIKGRRPAGRRGRPALNTSNSLERNGTRYVSAEAPISVKSSIPAIPRVTFERLCYESAIASNLPPNALSPLEAEMLSEILENPTWLSLYLSIRNGICYLWHRNPTLYVSFNEALGIVREKKAFPLASLAFEFLSRNGHINYGCIYIISSLKLDESLSQKTVAIIGAGMAGISCARQLTNLFAQYEQDFLSRGEKPPRIVIYEASERLGGHIYTHMVPLSDNEVSEKSSLATTVNATNECMVNLLTDSLIGMPTLDSDPLYIISSQQLSLDAVHTRNREFILHDIENGRIDTEHVQRIFRLFDALLFYFNASASKQPLHSLITPPEQEFIQKLDQIGWYISIEAFPLQIKDTLSEFLGNSANTLTSLLHLTVLDLKIFEWFKEYLSQSLSVSLENVYPGSIPNLNLLLGENVASYSFKHGMADMLNSLASTPSPLPILFDQCVHTVKLEDNTVNLSFVNETTVSVDKVVICIPMDKLNTHLITFEPPLEEKKLKAIDRCHFTNVKKVILIFKTQFWEPNISIFGSLPQDSGRNFIFNDCTRFYEHPTLSVFVKVEGIDFMKDDDIVNGIVSQLKKVYKPKSEAINPIRTIISNWENNSYTNHSSYQISNLFLEEDYAILSEPIDNTVFFASEAISQKNSGSIRGAFDSGILAARDVLASLIGNVVLPNTLVIEENLEQPRKTYGTKRNAQQALGKEGERENKEKRISYHTEYLRLRQKRLDKEQQECDLLIAELLGPSPVPPSRPSANPYLLYQKTQWHVCKTLADQDKQRVTGDPEARATKNEIRAKLGKTWRALDSLGKQPWVDEINARRANYSTRLEEYQRQINSYNVRVAQIKSEHQRRCESQPIPEDEAKLKLLAEQEDEHLHPEKEGMSVENSDDDYHDDLDYEDSISEVFPDNFS